MVSFCSQSPWARWFYECHKLWLVPNWLLHHVTSGGSSATHFLHYHCDLNQFILPSALWSNASHFIGVYLPCWSWEENISFLGLGKVKKIESDYHWSSSNLPHVKWKLFTMYMYWTLLQEAKMEAVGTKGRSYKPIRDYFNNVIINNTSLKL